MSRANYDVRCTLGDIFKMKRDKSSDGPNASTSEKLALLQQMFSEREVDSDGRVVFKLPLQLLENRLNIAFKTQANLGHNADIEVISHTTGSIYVRFSAEWDIKSAIKPPVKYFSIKITPCHTELYNVNKQMPSRQFTDFTDSEFPHYDSQMERIAWQAVHHNLECQFFAFSKQSRSISLKVPIAYSMGHLDAELTDPGIIMLEDFDKTATFPPTTNLSVDALKSIVTALAEIHAVSLEKPEEWSAWEYPGYGRLTTSHFMPAISAIRSAHPVLFGQLFDRIFDVITACLDEHYDNNNNTGKQLVLAHGYLNASNLRWKKNEEDEITEEFAYITNWQGVHPGTFCEDLAYLLSGSTCPETRRNETDALIDLYVDQLGHKITPVPFSACQIKESLQRHFRFEALRALLPIADFLSEASKSETYKNDSPDIMNVLLRAKCLVEDLVLPLYDTC